VSIFNDIHNGVNLEAVHGCTTNFLCPFKDCYSRHSKFMVVASRSHEFF